MIPVVELLRVSTLEQGGEDRAGIPRQIEANRRTVERCGLNVLSTIRLIDVSGASVMHAPEIGEMLSLLRTGRAQGIVCADFDRLLRPDDFRSLAILQDIREAGALIYLPDQIIDLNTQSGYLISGINSIIAGNELAQIKKRMHGAKEEKRRQGKHPGNHLSLPFGVGYDRKAERYFYTDDAEKVRQLFDQFHGHRVHNYTELARRLGFSSNVTVRNLLSNEIYIGYRHYKQKRAPERKVREDGRQKDKRKVPRAPGEIIRVKVIDNPLVPEEVFWEVQDIIHNRWNDFTDRKGASKRLFLYAGLLRCGICGSPMYTVPGGKAGPNKDYYYCRNKAHHWRQKGVPPCPSSYLRREPVEEMLASFIAENLSNPDFVLAGLVALFESRDGCHVEHERADLDRRLVALKQKKAKLATLVVDGVFTLEDVAGKAKAMQEEIGQLEARREALAVPPEPERPEDYREAVEAMAAAFTEFPFWSKEERREFLKIQRPEFWITTEGVTRYSIPVCKNSSQMGRGSWPPPACCPPGRSARRRRGRWSPRRLPAAGASPPARSCEIPAARPETAPRDGPGKSLRGAGWPRRPPGRSPTRCDAAREKGGG
ncbi:recombinase family protein [Nitratidesulfovibrio sp. HK-II]